MAFILSVRNVCALSDRYAVRFVPRENGVHFIHVRLNGNHIPGSPFRLFVGKQDADASLVRAYGDGLSHGSTGESSLVSVPLYFLEVKGRGKSSAYDASAALCVTYRAGFQRCRRLTSPHTQTLTCSYTAIRSPSLPFVVSAPVIRVHGLLLIYRPRGMEG